MKKILVSLAVGSVILAVSGLGFADDSGYIAGKGGNKFHVPTCSIVKSIEPQNRVTYKTPEEAVKAGYQPCQLCNPPAKTPQFVASKGSGKYHVPSCSSAKNIGATNLVYFNSEDDAVKAGYKPCQVCLPKAGGAVLKSPGVLRSK